MYQMTKTTHFFIINIPEERKTQQISIDHPFNIDFKDFKNLSRKCATKNNHF